MADKTLVRVIAVNCSDIEDGVKMRIGEIIRKYRKEKELTQEQLAGLLGVTASAVNKWEKGSACPDIALLAPIARALGVSLDTLLAYHEKLTKEEVNDILRELRERMDKEPYQTVFGWVQDKIRTFPNSEELIVQAAAVLNAYRIVGEVPDEKQYDAQILEWFERGLVSQDEGLRMMAAQALYSFYLSRQEYEKAGEYLQYFSDQNPEKKYRQALLYGRTGQMEEAYRAYEELLFEEQNRVMMILNGIYVLSLQEKDFEWAHYIADKIEQIAGSFEMGRYYEVGHRLELAVQERDKERCIRLAREMLDTVVDLCGFTKSPLYRHMTFRGEERDNLKEEKAKDFSQTMRETLLRYFRDEEIFGFMEQDERWRQIVE